MVDQGIMTAKGKLKKIHMGIKPIYLWQYVYLLIVYVLTFFIGRNDYLVFALLFVLALPFINETERFLEICLVLSPIAYFFSGADEAVFSLYTIYVGFLALRGIVKRELRFPQNFWSRLFLIFVFIISYRHSTLAMSSGMYELIYVVVISVIVSSMGEMDEKEPLKRLPNLCMCGICVYAIALAIRPVIQEGRYTFSGDVNVNTLGFSATIMTVIILIDLFEGWHTLFRGTRMIIAMIGFGEVLMTGSRNGLMALAGSVFVYLFVKGWRNKKLLKAILWMVSLSFLAIIGIYVAYKSGMIMDASRLDLEKMISSGGTNRVHVWKEIIPYVYKNCFYWGLGPGKYGTHVILQKLVFRSYSHAHNTLVEAFAETGIVGFVLMTILLIGTGIQAFRLLKKNRNGYRIVFFFICTMFAGIGESYFNDIVLWLPIGMLGFPWNSTVSDGTEDR